MASNRSKEAHNLKQHNVVLVLIIPITLNSRLSISKRQPDALKTLQERF